MTDSRHRTVAWLGRHIQRCLLTGGLLCLGGCLHLQLGGAVTEATLTVTPLRDTASIIEQVSTPSLAQVRDEDGPARWDRRRDIGRFVFLGNVILDEDRYDPDTLYLVTAYGGRDQDPDVDNALDGNPALVTGQWHAILSGEQLTRGKVSPLTEAAYRYLELNLVNMSDAGIRAELDRLSRLMVADVDRSGAVNYEDLLSWHRHFNANTYLHDIEAVNALSAAIRETATAATLRRLSADVIGADPGNAGPYTVSGSVSVSATTRADSDVNNPEADYESNDSFGRAQAVINPLILGGYLNLPGEGAEGGSQTIGDLEDFYRVDLLAGQRITLIISEDPAANDLDLYLYDEPDINNPVDAALSVEEVEQLTVPADGEYWINVSAFAGASNYLLTVGIGDLSPELEARQRRLSDDFVPGEIIARFRGSQDARQLRRHGRLPGMRVRGGGPGRAHLLEMDDTGPRQGPGLKRRKLQTLRTLKRLARHESVESAALNYRVQALAKPNDVYYNQQRWHYEMINLPAAWDRSLGDGVIVAVVDTGIRRGHPDMAGQLVPGYDFVRSLGLAGDGSGIDSNPEDPGDSDDGTPSSFHGTHVAGTVAAATNNDRGVAGVAWNAKIMPLRALGVGGGTTYDVRQAIRFAAGLPNDSGTLPARPADVINLSLGGGGFSVLDQNVFSDIAARGIIVVAAAGNEASARLSYPASYDNVISVSAVNINQARASYSNFGSRVDVAAPGGDSFTRDVNGDGVADLILSTAADDSNSFGGIRDTYSLLQGTSMATPHVAGVIALMKSVYPALTVSEFEGLLAQGVITDDLGSAGRDNTFGWGLINANKAVLVADGLARGSDVLKQPRIATSTSSLNFGNFADVLPLTVSNGGTGTLTGIAVAADASWLSVEPDRIDADGLGVYNIAVDRSQLAEGSHTADITVSANGLPAIAVTVIVQQPDPSALTNGDAGLHYILLINADDPGISCEASTPVVDGNYPFEFRNVPPGRYQIYGGSDADNDFFICDPGEACGAWPVLDAEPVVIDVQQNLTGLSFSSTFSTGIISTSDAAAAEPHLPLRRSAWRGGAIPANKTGRQAASLDCSFDLD